MHRAARRGAARLARPAAPLLLLATLLATDGCRERGGKVHEVDLVAAPARLALIDGQELDVWAYDGRVPGPTYRIRLGDTLRVRFTNRLPQPTTVHWHGVRVPNAMDGVPGVTQPPVEPGGTFTYELTPPDAGTYWFHPHVRSSEQVERGLFGVLIVEDREPLPYARDETWVLDDVRLGEDGQISPAFNTRHDLAHDGRWGSVVLVNGRRGSELHVTPGERVRLRLVNVANGRVFAPDFSPLDAQIVAVDGLYTARPLPAVGFELAPGNRADLDLAVPASLAGRRIEIWDRFTRRPFPLAAIVVGSGSPVATPDFPLPSRALDAAWSLPADSPVRAEMRLNARAGGDFGIEWTINDTAMAHGEHGSHAPAFALPLGETSRVHFRNESYRLHPMHLHGMFFRVRARNGVPVDEPFTRDTVLVHSKETVEVAVRPLDAGLWMAHCHVLEHAEAGMMTLLDVR